MHEIKIYGEIVPFQDDWLAESGYCNLTYVQEQLKKANGKDVKVRINSMGGDVDEGFAIYSELRRYASANNAKIETFAEGRCASIATVIFLAGDTRTLNEYVQPFVHNAWTYAMGDANQMTRVVNMLEECNVRIAQHYAQHTDLTYEEARELMNAETYISAEECKALRFATQIEEILRPVALEKIIKNKLNTDTKMSTKKSPSKGILEQIKALVIGAEVKNLELNTADGATLVFADVEDRDPEVGDYATMDGQPADGKYVVYEGKKTFVFGDGYLNEIIDNEDGEELREENAQLFEAVNLLKEKFEEVSNLLKDEKVKNAELSAKIRASSKEIVEPVNVKKEDAKKNTVSEAVLNIGKRDFKYKK